MYVFSEFMLIKKLYQDVHLFRTFNLMIVGKETFKTVSESKAHPLFFIDFFGLAVMTASLSIAFVPFENTKFRYWFLDGCLSLLLTFFCY